MRYRRPFPRATRPTRRNHSRSAGNGVSRTFFSYGTAHFRWHGQRQHGISTATRDEGCAMGRKDREFLWWNRVSAGVSMIARRGPITAVVLAFALMIAVPASASSTASTTTASTTTASRPAAVGRAYLDAKQPIRARVNDLLGRMTLPEKTGQMVQIEVTQVTDTSNDCTSQGGFNLPNPVCEQKIFIDNNVGSILAGGTDIP